MLVDHCAKGCLRPYGVGDPELPLGDGGGCEVNDDRGVARCPRSAPRDRIRPEQARVPAIGRDGRWGVARHQPDLTGAAHFLDVFAQSPDVVAAADGDQTNALSAGQIHSGVGGDMRRGLAPAPCTVDSRAGIAERLDHCASCGLNLSGSNAGHIRREPDHTM